MTATGRLAAMQLAAMLVAGGGRLAAAVPQAPTATPRPPATLHQAWLCEVMDLAPARAAELYREVARDPAPDNLERWVAIARLAELQRLGITKAPPVDLLEAPPPLRASLTATAQPLDLAAAAARATQPPAQLLQAPATERLPALRPAVPEAAAWLLGQIGPSWRDRFRQRQLVLPDRTLFNERLNATRIVVAELDGRRAQADEVRNLYFTNWRPPAVSADHPANLRRIRANLETLLRGRELPGTQNLLTRLGEAVDRIAATDPGAAIGLVLRLPFFAERLLAEPEERGR